MVSKALSAQNSSTSRGEKKETACAYWEKQLLFAHLQNLRVLDKKPVIIIITGIQWIRLFLIYRLTSLCVPYNPRSFLSPFKYETINFQQLSWWIQLTCTQFTEFVSLVLFYSFELEWNADSGCREPRMWRLSCHWMRHRSQVIPARSFSWWQLTLAGAWREHSSISQLSARCDNNNLILRLGERVRLSFSVFARKHAAWGLVID